jgi:hypothetical protein
MHTARIVVAMVAGGYASILAAYLIAAHAPLADAGRDGVIFGPLTVAVAAVAVSLLTYRRPATAAAPAPAKANAGQFPRARKAEA